jgi:predicted TIM-barrel fold metal-dependent hydrolase
VSELPIVDAHQHFWDLERNYLPWLCDEPMIPFRYGDYSALRRSYLPRDYFRDTAGYDVVKTVYVETEWDPHDFVGETKWLQEVIAETGFPHAIVAGARLDHPEVAAVLVGHAAFPRVRGIRHKPRAAPSPEEVVVGARGSMGDPAWRRGYALLAQTQIILNHTGLPADRSEGLAGWRTAMQTLASRPNVAVKISGLGQPGQPWTVEANGPIVRDTISIFGLDRCMFASNFPVDGLCAEFDTIFAGFKAIVRDLPRSEQRKLFYANATRIYRLDPEC